MYRIPHVHVLSYHIIKQRQSAGDKRETNRRHVCQKYVALGIRITYRHISSTLHTNLAIRIEGHLLICGLIHLHFWSYF